MNIGGLSSSGAMPALEKMFLFAGQRQRIISNNIANIDTPGYIGTDVNPKDFQKLLGDAIDQRRDTRGGTGELKLRDTRQVSTSGSRMVLNPTTPTAGVLFHDRGQKNLEHLMQQLVENASAFQVVSDLMRKNQTQLKMAIAQRV